MLDWRKTMMRSPLADRMVLLVANLVAGAPVAAIVGSVAGLQHLQHSSPSQQKSEGKE